MIAQEIPRDTLLQFSLPPELEAHEPPEARGLRRDEIRLLVTSDGGRRVEHTRFFELPRFLQPGDLLVANDSATLPAALPAHGPDGSAVPLHLSTRLDDGRWVVEPRTPGPPAALTLPDGGAATLVSPYRGSARLWVAELTLPEPVLAYLHRWGRPIAYAYVPDAWPLDRYQTVYARAPGSAEMPSAGRAFSPEVLAELRRRGIGFVTLTLHTGVSSLEGDESPYPERYAVPPETAATVQAARDAGRRVIAVGTTVVRALESALDAADRVVPRRGWTDLVVTPERGVQVVDGLLSGLHEPRSTHLAMLEAIVSRAHLDAAYRAALDGRYLWHEFGDLHLMLP